MQIPTLLDSANSNFYVSLVYVANPCTVIAYALAIISRFNLINCYTSPTCETARPERARGRGRKTDNFSQANRKQPVPRAGKVHSHRMLFRSTVWAKVINLM